jgi:hypothetical protein
MPSGGRVVPTALRKKCVTTLDPFAHARVVSRVLVTTDIICVSRADRWELEDGWNSVNWYFATPSRDMRDLETIHQYDRTARGAQNLRR